MLCSSFSAIVLDGLAARLLRARKGAVSPSGEHRRPMKRLRGMPFSQSMNGEPFRVSGSGGIIVASRASVPVNPSV